MLERNVRYGAGPAGRQADIGQKRTNRVDLLTAQTPRNTVAMDDQTKPFRWVSVRDCQGFLWAMYAAYEGLAFASFEGTLASLHLHEVPGASNSTTAALTREDKEPTSDFWTVPINEGTIKALKKKLSLPKILGKDGVVVHTQLATEEQLIFSACDNFHEECVRVWTIVPPSLLEELQRKGVIRHI